MNQTQKSALVTAALFIGGAVAVFWVSGFLIDAFLSLWNTLVSWVATAAFIAVLVITLSAMSSSGQAKAEPDPDQAARSLAHPALPMRHRSHFDSGKVAQSKHGGLVR
jgi:cytochrome c biogenesis protein CcdA